MIDPREALKALVSPSESHIRPFSGFIFLCGGPLDGVSQNPVSVRDAIFRELTKDDDLAARVRLAEDYKDWSHDGIYTDLVTFEDHIAQLSDLIVLVLESAGSLTELGLFTAIENYRHKLAVFISNYHYKQDSYVRLGPIKFLEDTIGNKAECHPWIKVEFNRPSLDVDELVRIQNEFADAVKDRLGKASAEKLFDKETWLHQALMVCEFIWLMSALTVSEIQDFLRWAGVELAQHNVRQMLFLLNRIGLIAIVERSTQRFYVSTSDRSFVKWKSIDEIFDPVRFRFDVLSYYKATDRKRHRALQSARSTSQ